MKLIRGIIGLILIILYGCAINNPLAHDMKLKKCECNVIYAPEETEGIECQLLSLNLSASTYVFNHSGNQDIYEVGNFKIDCDTLRLHPVTFMLNNNELSSIHLVDDSIVNAFDKNKNYLIHRNKLIKITTDKNNIKQHQIVLTMQKV